MPIYESASHGATQICADMMERYHGGLKDAGVTIDLLFAKARTDENGDSEGCALKLHGYQCGAVVKINAYKLRVQGHADAEIVIDGDRWDEWSEEEQAALIDHELEHLELKVDRNGNVTRDDLGRPKLRMRLHDHQFGWFDSIARRHGKASGEARQAEAFISGRYQQWLGFMKSPDTANEQGPSPTATDFGGSQEAFVKEVGNEFRKMGILAESGRRQPRKGLAGKPKSKSRGSRKAASSR